MSFTDPDQPTRAAELLRLRRLSDRGTSSLDTHYRRAFDDRFRDASRGLFVRDWFSRHDRFDEPRFTREWRSDPFRSTLLSPDSPAPDASWIGDSRDMFVPSSTDEQDPEQRKKALQILQGVTRRTPWTWNAEDRRWSPTLAAVMEPPVRAFYDVLRRMWAPELQAGKIGDYYESLLTDGVLIREATDENLRAIAEAETQWWRSAEGFTLLGALVGAPLRAGALIRTREQILSEYGEDALTDPSKPPDHDS